MSAGKIEIITADDHVLIRKGLIRVIEKTPDMTVVEEADDGPELMEKLKSRSYDLLLLDITMPGPDGLSLMKEIKANYSAMPIVVLTMHPEERYARQAFRAGASAYVTKRSAPKELVDVIRRVMAGKQVNAPETTAAEADREALESARPPHATLSDQEYRVFSMIVAGRTVGEIAADLGLTLRTIQGYRRDILKKMALKTDAQLTDYAFRNNLV